MEPPKPSLNYLVYVAEDGEWFPYEPKKYGVPAYPMLVRPILKHPPPMVDSLESREEIVEFERKYFYLTRLVGFDRHPSFWPREMMDDWIRENVVPEIIKRRENNS